MFREGTIPDVIVLNLARFEDERGWLTEIFRCDELGQENVPAMGYISVTHAGIVRGPHEHVEQSDHFCFMGPSDFKVYLWDNRKNSPTYMTKQVLQAGQTGPKRILIPPGVVHAYKNIGVGDGMVVNCPNRLFAGKGKKSPVDEIRHEHDKNTIFVVD